MLPGTHGGRQRKRWMPPPRASSRRNSFSPNSGNGGSKKISISLSTAVKTGGEAGGSYRWESPVKTEADLERLHFPVLRAGGGYSLEVSFPGYAKQQMPNIRISINQVQSVSFLLAPELTEKV